MDNLYINKCKSFIDFMLSQQQWSGLTKADIDSWLSNFRDLSHEEQEMLYKLLVNIIYFSEYDIMETLKIGVFICLSYDDIIEQQKNSKFSLSTHALQNIHNSNINKSCFVPLLDSRAPHESANNICRILVQQNIIPAERSKFIDEVPDLLKARQINNLIIVDDCVGSGDQLRKFWKETKINIEGSSLSIQALSDKYGVKVKYLTLFGYDKSISNLQQELKELKIYCIRKLNDHHRVFSDISYVWKDNEEKTKALALFKSLAKNAGIPIYGYKELDFAFVMHKTIPNWSLPIFWKENSDWKLLLRRKNSND